MKWNGLCRNSAFHSIDLSGSNRYPHRFQNPFSFSYQTSGLLFQLSWTIWAFSMPSFGFLKLHQNDFYQRITMEDIEDDKDKPSYRTTWMKALSAKVRIIIGVLIVSNAISIFLLLASSSSHRNCSTMLQEIVYCKLIIQVIILVDDYLLLFSTCFPSPSKRNESFQ